MAKVEPPTRCYITQGCTRLVGHMSAARLVVLGLGMDLQHILSDVTGSLVSSTGLSFPPAQRRAAVGGDWAYSLLLLVSTQ